MKPTISVLIVNFNSSEFVNLSLYALEKLTKNPYEVFIIDNGSKENDYLKLKKHCQKRANVKLFRRDTNLRGSMAHGTALNELLSMVKSPYACILDADATWLLKDWDDLLIKEMKGNIKAIGSQAPPKKPQDFPLMFTILLDTSTLKSTKVDFRPQDPKQTQDTGFEMREKFHKNGFKGKNLTFVNTRDAENTPIAKIITGIFYYKKDIISSHFGRGSTLGAHKYRKIIGPISYIPFIGKKVLEYIGSREKREWISICKKIINKQTE